MSVFLYMSEGTSVIGLEINEHSMDNNDNNVENV